MIAWLEGRIVARGTDHVVVDVRGVGYKVHVARQPEAESAALHVHHVVQQDAQRLFGFETREELALFDLLIGVPNVGPKAALSLLTIAGPAELAAAIATGDVAALAKAPGVGKKTAERLIVELRSKVQQAGAPLPAAPATDDDAVAALVALGYSAAEAARALRDVAKSATTTERVQAALRGIAR
jgi:Holliday junction DNA helicase RuvA